MFFNWESEVSKVKDPYIPKLADFFKVDINDLFKENSSNIVITQNNTDNKDNSINNSIIVLLNDKETVDVITSVIKRRHEDSQKG